MKTKWLAISISCVAICIGTAYAHRMGFPSTTERFHAVCVFQAHGSDYVGPLHSGSDPNHNAEVQNEINAHHKQFPTHAMQNQRCFVNDPNDFNVADCH
jgi:hypothetical protein